ncbi:hypothetical protein [Gemmiger sp. An50]|uniref:hypothetical protein n=1 Tax=Gemmiger sp. An50 TaxID=1965639 RepID=UPI000B3AEAF7|nr:hypothetical protein [Gemmiger sp. An50]OUN81930.1 hypothetical protein B5G03_16710 [Gemmiger sp. An50]
MKMKNMLIGGMSLALVACISVGATLAYLTDETGPVTNTFVMENGTEIQLWETADEVTSGEYKQAVTGEEAGTEEIIGTEDPLEGTNVGIDYTDVLPGAEIDKKPRLELFDGPESYVYAKVENPAAAVQTITFNTGAEGSKWTLVDGTQNIYRYNSTVTPTDDGAWTSEIFTTVTIDDEATDAALDDITITGFAIQAKGLENGVTTADAQAIEALS